MLSQTIHRRLFTLSLHAGLWLLLALVLWALRGSALRFHETEVAAAAGRVALPVTRLAALFASETSAVFGGDTNRLSPFATRHFTPAARAAAPPPTTRKVELIYQGFYQTGGQPQRIFIQMDGKMVVSPLGGNLAPGLFIAETALRTLTLTNSAGQTNVLKLNTKTNLEVPVK